jgi:hypothetical protein
MSSKPRGKSFSKAELESLLEIIEEALPIGMNEWEAVVERHLTRYPDGERTRESIKRKFSSLDNSKKPTGDPTCPPIVRTAKRIYNKIKERMDVSDGEDDGLEEDDAEYLQAEENSGTLVNESQESIETPSDTNLSTSISTTGGKSVGDEKNMAITPFNMVPAPKTKRRAGTAFGAESDPFAEYLKLMLLKSDKDNEAQAARHKEQMEMLERRDRLEERRAERQDKMMQMMMMQIMGSSSSASKKKKVTTLELSDNDDDDDDNDSD